MSVVVVVRKAQDIVIAADTVSKSGRIKIKSKFRTNHDKIMRFQDVYISTVGAVTHQDVLADALARYSDQMSFDDRESIFRSYLKLHPILRDEYFINTAAEKDDDYEPSQIDALIATSRGIFGMYSWRTVVEYEKFYAIGSGQEYALGAMHATYDRCSAEEIAIAGVSAACDFDDSSELPYKLYRLPAATAPEPSAVATSAS